MASCMHHGQGCGPKGTPLYKCDGYFEHSFACENYICEHHAHHTRYGTFCAQCDPAPPAFARPRVGRLVRDMTSIAAANTALRHGAVQHGALHHR